MNGTHEIIVAIPLDDCNTKEIVIGKRETEFLPYVVWKCYNGTDYQAGDYCQTYLDALESAMKRVKMNMLTRMRTFNVRYINPDNEDDETQFDIEDADFETMCNELVNLFGEFCSENYDDDPCWMTGVEEVPYDGEEE